MHSGMPKTWLSIYFPSLCSEIFSRGQTDGVTLAVCEGQGHQRRVVHSTASAYRAGIRPGMKVGAALALESTLLLCERNEKLERQALEQLAVWGSRYTSHVSLNFHHAVLLEVGGSRKLFGDYATLQKRIGEELTELGYSMQLAMAPTPLGAYWLSRGEPKTANFDAALAALPLARLTLAPKVLDGLSKLGLRRLGECFALPREGLRRRFGGEFLLQLDQARGLQADPQPIFAPPPRFEAELILPVEIYEHEALFFSVNRLIADLCAFLTARELGIQHLRLELTHSRLEPSVLSIGLVKATRRSEHLSLLTRERLQQLSLPAAVETIRLRSEELKPLAARTASLFEQHSATAMSPQEFIERLRSRLGEPAVQGIWQVAEHRPEYAWRSGSPGEKHSTFSCQGRPLWLLPAPKPLPAHVTAKLTLYSAPERIESGWWDGEDIQRDYFVARSTDGATLWIFRERHNPSCWYVHGLFG